MFDLTRLAAVRALVVGDVMLDRYWFGDVDRISPEAPVPVVSVDDQEERAGGAANVARNVAALGAKCSLLSVVGDDEAGRSLSRLLQPAGIDCRLHVDTDTSTTVKLRVMSLNQQLLRIDFETRPSHEVLGRCLDDFSGYLDQVDVVILSDYGKGGLTHIVDMIARARSAGIPVIVDPKGRDYSRYRGATLITPNRREFELVAGECAGEDELQKRAQELIAAFDFDRLLITRSGEGMTLFRADGSRLHSPARVREVYDVTGAGDTVIAVLGAALGARASDEDAMRLANAAAGVVVGKLGTAEATVEEVREALAEDAAD
jgi:rfaE bifunctional protein kinase chain/domain